MDDWLFGWHSGERSGLKREMGTYHVRVLTEAMKSCRARRGWRKPLWASSFNERAEEGEQQRSGERCMRYRRGAGSSAESTNEEVFREGTGRAICTECCQNVEQNQC